MFGNCLTRLVVVLTIALHGLLNASKPYEIHTGIWLYSLPPKVAHAPFF
jgi:hypothetical protein